MQKIKIVLATFFIVGLWSQVVSQGLHFGIRAGVNYAQYLGPQEANETYKLNNGFHFGMNVEYSLNDIVSIKTEFMYIQNGTKQEYDGESYYFFQQDPPVQDVDRILIKDNLNLDLDISNAYIGIPITAHFRTLDKWDFYGGVYFNFMVSSIGRGMIEFGGDDSETIDHQFIQGLDYNYRRDIAGTSGFPGYANNRFIRLISDGIDSQVIRFAGAYYQYEEKPANAFRGIDYGAVAGANYFLNPGLYLGLRVEYGLRDITDDRVDRSLININADNSLLLRDDNDRHLGLNLSLGFRF